MQIRKMVESDLDDLYEVISNPKVMEYIGPPFDYENTKQFLENYGLVKNPLIFATINSNNEFVGYIINSVYKQNCYKIGWLLKERMWQKGYCQELTRMLIQELESQGKSVAIECDPKQEVTKHIAKKYGFSYQGIEAECMVFERKLIEIEPDLYFTPYYPNELITLEWYQDLELCKQVDNIDYVYDLDLLKRMYSYLSSNGDCYYILYQGNLVGDITLLEDGEIAIVIAKQYQNKHIGRKCINKMIELAKGKGLNTIKANIYSFNQQSRAMFLKCGFQQIEEEWFQYNL